VKLFPGKQEREYRAKHPVLYKTPGAIQEARCYTKHPVGNTPRWETRFPVGNRHPIG
jgi:hypothetical protein